MALPVKGLGVVNHMPEGIWSRERAQDAGVTQAIAERDSSDPIAVQASRRMPTGDRIA
ncbi:MAG: hypothetical protein V4564_05515 [Pseudomonadota bacterium]|uniref:hypothetical protein n=1 Tax=Sphingomonas sp. ERG5 TaxID=1381597 RepID=UPI000ACF42F8|nr:hypothetical protein [Sphingomonas sp. ERG5]